MEQTESDDRYTGYIHIYMGYTYKNYAWKFLALVLTDDLIISASYIVFYIACFKSVVPSLLYRVK